MKNVFRYTSILVLIAITTVFLSCDSDDDGDTNAIVEQQFSVDVDAIIVLAANSDISTIANFGQPVGQSAADVETEVELDQTFLLGQPSGLQAGDEFLYSSLLFLDESGEEVPITDQQGLVVGGFLEAVLPPGVTGTTAVEYYNQEFNTSVAYRVIDVDDTNDTTWKYDIECYIRRNDQLFGPFIIDPRIKMKSRN